MVVRCSNLLNVTGLKHTTSENNSLFSLPCVNEDKAYSLIIGLKNKHRTELHQYGYLQCFICYNNSEGEWRVRVHNKAVSTTDDLIRVYRKTDMIACAGILTHQLIE